jgi:hypothetical protein
MIYLLLFLLNIASLAAAPVDAAYKAYVQGEHARDEIERKKAFNDALTLYLGLETDNSSGQLYYSIGNCYYQLGEYGFSVLYYYKALKYLPRDSKIRGNLQIALEKAGIKEPTGTVFEEYILFFQNRVSHNEMVVIGVVLLFVVFGLFSLSLWKKQPLYRKSAFIFLWISFAFTMSIVWSEYLAPSYAVVVKPTALRRDAGMEYAVTGAEPLIPGMRVQVVSVVKEGDWLKVSLPSGPEGFVSNEYVRLI